MAINTTLELLSDQAFGAAAAAYTAALICAAVEFASRRSARSAAESAVTAQQPALAGSVLTRDGTRSGVPVIPTVGPVVPRAGGDAEYGHVASPSRSSAPWAERFGRITLVVTALGVLAHLTSIVTRGFAAGRLPLGNLYEFTSAIAATLTISWLLVKLRQPAVSVGIFVLAPVTLLMFVSGGVLYTRAAELQPALNSYWKWIHVTTVAISSGVLMFSGIVSAAYLIRRRWEKRSGANGVGARLPALATLDRIAYRTAILAFPVYTFAVIAGALWAEVAWGRYWNWDPKETVAFVTWIVYAGYLHARATAGWRGARSAWISVLGLATILFNLFFVNMVIAGLHSYAGV